MFEELTARLSDKAVLITGGSSGIGLCVARMLRAAGARVGVVSNDARQLAAMGDGYRCLACDITRLAEVRRAVDGFAADAGRIDALVNCAGVSKWRSLLEMDEAFWDLIYNVNVKGTFLMCQAAARHMIPRQSGVIVNISSMSGLKSGMPNASAYASSKWAIVGLSRNLHLELKPHGIRVGCLCPGSTLTDIHKSAQSPDQDKMIPPEEMARTVCFMLAAPATGHAQLVAFPAMFEDWR